jgi:glycosyltransferase involved in cell wall biosynthesis
MPAPTVSVIMPAYNHERFVADAVRSVLEQSVADLELIVIDDGSTDRTAAVIGGFQDSRLHYHHQQNQDAYNALNRGMSLARGDYVAIINSDDVFAPGRLAALLEAAAAGARFVFTDVEPVDDEGAPLADDHPWRAWHAGNRAAYLEHRDLYRGFLHGNFMVTTSNIFMTRELAQAVGGFAPIRYLHDYDYVFRLLLRAEADSRYLEDRKLLQYRVHAGNTLSEAAITGREQDREVIRSYLLQRLPEDCRPLAGTGIDRLIELEHELLQVRAQLRRQNAPPRQPPASLTRRVLRRLKRTFQDGL